MNGALRSGMSGYLFALPYLVLFGGFVALPLVFGLGLSFFDWELISAVPPRFAGLANYGEALRSSHFWNSMGATLRFVVMTVPLVTGAALALALLLDALPARMQSFCRASLFMPSIISVSVAGLLWRWMYNNDFGVLNALLARWDVHVPWITDARWAMKSLVLMTVWWTVGGPMVILLAGLKQIPPQLKEAASVDGATAWQTFVHVTIPQLRPVLLLVVVINTIASFQVFGQPFLVTAGGPELSTRVLVQYVYDMAFGAYRMGFAAAMSWLLFIAIAAISYVQTRLMKES